MITWTILAAVGGKILYNYLNSSSKDGDDSNMSGIESEVLTGKDKKDAKKMFNN